MYKVTKLANDQYHLEERIAEGIMCHAEVFHLLPLLLKVWSSDSSTGIHVFFSNFRVITDHLRSFCCHKSGMGPTILRF